MKSIDKSGQGSYLQMFKLVIWTGQIHWPVYSRLKVTN